MLSGQKRSALPRARSCESGDAYQSVFGDVGAYDMLQTQSRSVYTVAPPTVLVMLFYSSY